MDRFKASLSIEGMTCASCSNGITEALKRTDWISKATVNLLTNSATVEFFGKDKAREIVDAIEDLGYDAHLDEVVETKDEDAQEDHESRTVEIRVDGFHCGLCPNRAVTALLALREESGAVLDIVGQPTKERPIMAVRYAPQPSGLNIRRILAAIHATDPAFRATIYHPPTAEERSRLIQAREQRRIMLRLAGTFVIAIPTFVVGIVYMSLVSHENAVRQYLMESLGRGISRAQVILCVLSTPVYLAAADIFHRRAIKEIWHLWRPGSKVPLAQRFYRFGSMNMLMSLGTTIAYISSVAELLAAAANPPQGMVDDSNFYFDSVVFLTLFLLAGRLIEAYSKHKTGDAVEMLGKLRPTTAFLVVSNDSPSSTSIPSGSNEEGKKPASTNIQTVDADLLDIGDTIHVAHGDSPPCDGEVASGDTKFDESSLTGESRLIKKTVGDGVFAGTVNKGSPIKVRVTGVTGQSMLDQIVSVVREGQTKRAPMEKIADVLTAYFVPAITVIAILTWLLWFVLGSTGVIPEHYLDGSSWIVFSIRFAIAVFVVACPCGLGLAAPTAIYVGGGLAAKHGILAKGGGEAFEKASRIKCVVFDKTGTLTQGGQPEVTDHVIAASKDSLVPLIRSLAQHSSHPVSKAIVSFCPSEHGASVSAEVNDVTELPGRGLKGTSNAGEEMILGNAALMSESGVSISEEVDGQLNKWKREGKSVSLVATKSPGGADYQLAAYFAISDPIRPEAPAVVAALQDSGIEVWMLSGDNSITACAVAQRIGIPETHVIAGVLPTEKATKVQELQARLTGPSPEGKKQGGPRATIAMVGDGINDAPALAVADVGVAVGSGTDVAISSADFVLVASDLRAAATLLALSRAVFRRIKLNFAWAVVYNAVAVPFAAGCFYALGVRLDPVWASLAMALSSISVVLSSLALRSRVPGLGFRPRQVVVGEV